MIKIDYNYNYNIGRKIFENSNFRFEEPIQIFSCCKKKYKANFKSIDKINSLILSLNTIHQNDLFSGINFLYTFRSFFESMKNKFLLIKILNHTNQFPTILQKILTGNSCKINHSIFPHLLTHYCPDKFTWQLLHILYMNDRFDNFIEKESNTSGIFPLFKSIFKEKKMSGVNFFLNKYPKNSLVIQKFKSISHFKYVPFLLNCKFFDMEFFVHKLFFLYQYAEEHFGFKLCKNTLIKRVGVPSYYLKINLKNIVSLSQDYITSLLILQSVETIGYHGRILLYKILISHGKSTNDLLLCHPIETSMVKKIKSYFFF